ncbi:MAG: alpha/beta hydrolase [Candidatus Heimdallarchaeota archaeon]
MYNKSIFKNIYRNVTAKAIEQLINFRLKYQLKQLNINGTKWEYLINKIKKKQLLVLTGATRFGEAYPINHHLINEYKLISPTYPCLDTINQLIDGIAIILETENIYQINMLGNSFGGVISQCFIRKYPEKVSKLILANTLAPDPLNATELKLINKLLPIVPKRLIQTINKRKICKSWAEISVNEQDFWQAYCCELVTLHMTKKCLINQYKIAEDYCRNYRFTPNDLIDWKGKLLIIESNDDQLINEKHRITLKKTYPEAQVHSFQNGGHMPVLTRSEEFLSIINRFLKGS